MGLFITSIWAAFIDRLSVNQRLPIRWLLNGRKQEKQTFKVSKFEKINYWYCFLLNSVIHWKQLLPWAGEQKEVVDTFKTKELREGLLLEWTPVAKVKGSWVATHSSSNQPGKSSSPCFSLAVSLWCPLWAEQKLGSQRPSYSHNGAEPRRVGLDLRDNNLLKNWYM